MLLQTAPDAPLDVEQTDTKRDTKRETNRQTHTERKKVRVRERERETDRQRERERDSTTPISLTFLNSQTSVCNTGYYLARLCASLSIDLRF